MMDGHPHGGQFDPQRAIGRADEVARRVRADARWHGWAWLAIAVATPVFWLGVQVGEPGRPAISFWVAGGFGVFALVLWAQEARRPVRGRATARVDRPATRAYIGAVLLLVGVSLAASPTGMPGWYVILALLPAIPALVAAAIVLRA